MSNTRAKLQTLIKSEDWHPSTLALFNSWNDQLNTLETDQNFLDMPKVKKLAAELEEKIARLNDQLLTDRDLTPTERANIFTFKDVLELTLFHFSSKENNKQISLIDHEIEEEAKAHNISL